MLKYVQIVSIHYTKPIQKTEYYYCCLSTVLFLNPGYILKLALLRCYLCIPCILSFAQNYQQTVWQNISIHTTIYERKFRRWKQLQLTKKTNKIVQCTPCIPAIWWTMETPRFIWWWCALQTAKICGIFLFQFCQQFHSASLICP